MRIISDAVLRLTDVIFPCEETEKANHISRRLNTQERSDFMAEMNAHGCKDESRDESSVT